MRQALSFSPENTALRKLLADTLCKYGRFEAAELEYKEVLMSEPENTEVKVALANAYFQQEKQSEAFVVLEGLETAGKLDRAGKLLYARLLSRTTELVKAAQYYQALKDADPGLLDEELEAELAPFLIEYGYHDPDDPRRVLAGDVEGDAVIDIEKSKIAFKDVGGMESVKEQVRMKVIHPIEKADLFKAYGKSVGGGILLYGPPGCGKTYIARATAGEVNASFLPIGLHDVLDMWIGQSEKNLHEIFDQARRSQPTVLFFDEVDALGANRSDLKHSGGRNTINQFLSELDGVTGSNDGVLILAATNAPWHLDPAFRRPGRFDEIIFVPPPDEAARAAILRVMLQGKPVDAVDYEAVAAKTHKFSGADLKSVVDRAIEQKLSDSMKSDSILPIKTKDLLKAAKKIKPSTQEWFATARNYALYSNKAGLYDEILDYLKQ